MFDAAQSTPVSPSQPAVPDELGVRGWEEGVRVTHGCLLSNSEHTVGMWVRILESIPQGSQILLQGSASGGGNFGEFGHGYRMLFILAFTDVALHESPTSRR